MSDHEVTVSGHALLGERLEMSPVTIVVKSGVITHIEYESHPPDLWICPAFFNAHTHLGDTIAMDINCAGQDLVSLVTPPEGLKHRISGQYAARRPRFGNEIERPGHGQERYGGLRRFQGERRARSPGITGSRTGLHAWPSYFRARGW